MDWERTHRQLLKAERQVLQAESLLDRARKALRSARYDGHLTIDAALALKHMEDLLEYDLEKRDRLKNQLRLLTH